MSPLPVVHQLLPHLRVGDAAGSHTLAVRDALRDAGFESDLFVEQCDTVFEGDVFHFGELGAHCRTGRTALLYQLAIGSELAEALMGRPEPILVNYHNLTPASFFWRWDPGLVEGIVWGHRQLHQLARRTRHAIAVSAFNRRDLDLAGYHSTAVAPPLLALKGTRGPTPARSRGGRGARWLFVGRLAPNKAPHDLVKALAAYRRVYDPEARLTLVGGQGHPLYTDAVSRLVGELDLTDAVDLAGSITPDGLEAAYREADVFVCLSDHEGFCFPILEAMDHQLPVVAYGAAAVGDTVGSGGLVLGSKRPAVVAAAVHRVLSSPGCAERLVAAGNRRLEDFALAKTRRQMVAEVRRGLELSELLDPDGGAGGARAVA